MSASGSSATAVRAGASRISSPARSAAAVPASSGRCATCRSASQPGEAIGVVGRNGQGKSTLLKLVAEVILPDEGSIGVHGGVAPLIEITGGFVDDLTVRDNVYLTAGLHGMTRPQIDARFDEIIEFAEIGDFLDTPYKHLSSGMKVRIAFAVISRLEEPIMLVDEVLAVGRQGVPGEVLSPHRGAARRRAHPVLRLAQRERPAPLLHARALPRQGPARARRPHRRGARPLRRRLRASLPGPGARASAPDFRLRTPTRPARRTPRLPSRA